MPLRIVAENQIYGKISEVHFEDENTIIRMIESVPKESLLYGVSPRCNTMFNSFQSELIVEEIDAMPNRSPEWDQLREAAWTAHRRNGYLVFMPDGPDWWPHRGVYSHHPTHDL